jgi:hypothetical protein
LRVVVYNLQDQAGVGGNQAREAAVRKTLSVSRSKALVSYCAYMEARSLESVRIPHFHHILRSVAVVTVEESILARGPMKIRWELNKSQRIQKYSRADVKNSLLAEAHLGDTLVPTCPAQLGQQWPHKQTYAS